MKVLNLQCGAGHGFEGWFGSEDDFQSQLARGMVECPMCGTTTVAKLPSAPRLNLGATPPAADHGSQQQGAWLAMMRRALAKSEDVGTRFAEEARRMHQGDAPERAIHGNATVKEARELLAEGIGVMPVPNAVKGTLQ